MPTGNLGNAVACVLARACGLPIGRIVLATNANPRLPDFFAGAEYTPRRRIATLANAMDVGVPSNFERLRWLHPRTPNCAANSRSTPLATTRSAPRFKSDTRATAKSSARIPPLPCARSKRCARGCVRRLGCGRHCPSGQVRRHRRTTDGPWLDLPPALRNCWTSVAAQPMAADYAARAPDCWTLETELAPPATDAATWRLGDQTGATRLRVGR